MSDGRFSADPVLKGLMGFQRDAVDHVFTRLHDEGGSRRFLVADETGLGKSIVARGLIAKTIERLQDDPDVDRIDIVYVCSNMDLARQNIGRLNVTGEQEVSFSSRLTMLGQHSARLNQRERRQTFNGKLVNLISFTPSTSFDPGHQTGQAQERALLALVLEEVLGLDRRQMQWTTRLLQGAVSTVRRMRRLVATMRHELGSGVDRQVVDGFARIASEGSRPSLSRFEELLDETMQAGGVSRARSQRARGVIGDLRRDLAKAGIATLEPDLVILDEFQRFRPLLDRDNDAGALAHDLFSFPSAKVVLLSATPYKPFTYAEEAEDHAKDFLRTIRFLHNETDAHSPRTNDVASLLADYRRDITTGADAHQSAQAASSALLRVMSRNERPLIEERSMLDVRLDPADKITGTDLAGYVQLSELARVVSPTAGLVSVDYWKSAPYFLTFCNGYRLRQRIKECDRPELQPALTATPHLTRATIEGRREVDLGNARIRQLADEFIEGGLWRLLWMPPSLSYLEPSGPYSDRDPAEITKRLVFSSWTATPASVASLLSYEVDRRLFEGAVGGQSERGQTLVYRAKSDTGRPPSMTTLMMFWPMPGLARLADPRVHARRHGASGMDDFLAQALSEIESQFGGTATARETETDDAQRVWQAAFAKWSSWPEDLDRIDDITRAMAPTAKATTIDHQREQTEASRYLIDHVDYAFDHDPAPVLRPEDVRILAEVGAFSPANISWRVLHRLFPPSDGQVTEDGLMVAAAALAGGLRTLFNTPHATAVVRAADHVAGRGHPQWRQVLHYTAMGNLEAALDEWLFNRRNEASRTWTDSSMLDFVRDEAAAISLRTSTLTAFDASRNDSDGTIPFALRFAVRYGARETHGGDDARMPEVRSSFNSPFWPFVLVSTSVGQEGIDFHWWCHAILHWNTPANPVDFEQREGRVDRFRGHAIRKNVALRHGASALRGASANPWEALFELANDLRGEHGHFTPDWVYPGPAKIQRHIAPYAMSRDEERYRKVERDVALYRLALGQPRQEDMVTLVRRQLESGTTPARINLMPS